MHLNTTIRVYLQSYETLTRTEQQTCSQDKFIELYVSERMSERIIGVD